VRCAVLGGPQRVRQTLPPIMTASAVETHRRAVLAHLQAIGFMKPIVASWQALGRQWSVGIGIIAATRTL
jgi:hypothetical protein